MYSYDDTFSLTFSSFTVLNFIERIFVKSLLLKKLNSIRDRDNITKCIESLLCVYRQAKIILCFFEYIRKEYIILRMLFFVVTYSLSYQNKIFTKGYQMTLDHLIWRRLSHFVYKKSMYKHFNGLGSFLLCDNLWL